MNQPIKAEGSVDHCQPWYWTLKPVQARKLPPVTTCVHTFLSVVSRFYNHCFLDEIEVLHFMMYLVLNINIVEHELMYMKVL